MDLIHGDKLYSMIYMELQHIYNCQIDRQFMIDMIDLKNKKRES